MPFEEIASFPVSQTMKVSLTRAFSENAKDTYFINIRALKQTADKLKYVASSEGVTFHPFLIGKIVDISTEFPIEGEKFSFSEPKRIVVEENKLILFNQDATSISIIRIRGEEEKSFAVSTRDWETLVPLLVKLRHIYYSQRQQSSDQPPSKRSCTCGAFANVN
jgi:hypothetical protein